MSGLSEAIDQYLALRRALGYKLHAPGMWLRQFAVFLEEHGANSITTPLALEWAQQPAQAQPAHWARRLGAIRDFAQHHSVTDPRTEVPPAGLLPHHYRRQTPYIYTDDDLQRLFQAVGELPSATGLRPQTYLTLLGLLAVTGMRISEGVALTRHDVDLADGVLTIGSSKFSKSRLIPVHPSTRDALTRYAAFRDKLWPRPTHRSFFLNDQGHPVTAGGARWTFIQLSRKVGLRSAAQNRGPRLHDLRHRFAVTTLLRWYQTGVDVERHLPELSTYLGHQHVAHTYWYLSAVPDLLQLVVARLETGAKEHRS